MILSTYMLVASLAYILMVVGLCARKNRKIHPALMTSAMVLDIVIVLILEVGRSAINTAMSFELNLFQQGHIASSLLAVILYIPVSILGVKYLKNNITNKQKELHKALGIACFVLRSLGFVLMFSFVTRAS